MSDNVPHASFTTNEHDRAEAAKLTARLAESQQSGSKSKDYQRVPSVCLARGAHKYVLIAAREPGGGELRHFVTSREGARYHRHAANPTVNALESSGYEDIEILGGGRVNLDKDAKKIAIFGFSYGFGQADHELSKKVVEDDSRYKDYEITVSNEGY